MANFKVQIITDTVQMAQFSRVWAQLVSHPNVDFDFYSLIVNVRSQYVCPYLMVIVKGDQPISLLVGRIESTDFPIACGYKVLFRPKIRRLTIIEGGFMGDRSVPVCELAAREVLQSLRDLKVDMLSWDCIPSQSGVSALLQSLPGILCRDYLVKSRQHWAMNLPASLAEFIEQKMNKKHRYWAKRTMRALEKDFPKEIRYACYRHPAEVSLLLQDGLRVARKTYQWSLGAGLQDNLESRERLRLSAEKGWLRGYLLYVKEEPVAFWITTEYQGAVYLNSTGYDPDFRKYEVGTALFLYLVGEACRRNLKRLDFGLGSAHYKERFGDEKFEETSVNVFASSFRGISLNAVRLMAQGPPEAARAFLLRTGLERRVKRIWRRFITPVRGGSEPLESRQ